MKMTTTTKLEGLGAEPGLINKLYERNLWVVVADSVVQALV